MCTACLLGYIPSIDKTECLSVSCSSMLNCQACSSLNICTSCILGYYLSVGGASCVRNSCSVSNCVACAANGTCLKCSSSFFLIDSQCRIAFCTLPFCSSCKQYSSFCDACISGYSWNIWKNICQEAIVNGCLEFGNINRVNYQCLTCSSVQACNTCTNAYTYQNISDICSPLCSISNCIRCLSAQYCAECAFGFLLSANLLNCTQKCSIQNCIKCQASLDRC